MFMRYLTDYNYVCIIRVWKCACSLKYMHMCAYVHDKVLFYFLKETLSQHNIRVQMINLNF